jgi:beta propeller repeat protein
MPHPHATRAPRPTITLLLGLVLLATLPVGQPALAQVGPRASAPFVLAGGTGVQQSPSLGGGVMAYAHCRGGDCDVYTLDLATRQAVPLSEGVWDEDQPHTDGQRIVWRDDRSATVSSASALANTDLFGANLSDRKAYPVSRARRMQTTPRVWGNYAVWADFRTAQDVHDQEAGDIYLFDIPGGTETAIAAARSAQVRPAISGDYVVWADFRNEPDPNGTNADIYAYHIPTAREIAISTIPGTQTDPAVSGSIVVWADYRAGQGDIYAYDLAAGREFAVSTATGSQTQPAVWGNIVVWTDWRNDPGGERGIDSDIYAYDLTTRREFPVFVGPGRQGAPSTASGVVAWEDYAQGNSDPDVMGATLSGVTLNAPPAPPPLLPGAGSRLFPETGRMVTGVFLDHWTRSGGLAQQGFPISDVISETSALDGKVYTVQYFERAVFEYHPENPPPHNVLLAQLGTFRLRGRYPSGPPAPPIPAATLTATATMTATVPVTSTVVPAPISRLFPETSKTVSGRFLQYWEQNGGLAQQGYPISEPFVEVSEVDGKPYLVQYFERAVFEYHPENPAPNDVLLSLLGTFIYRQRYPSP